MTQLGRSRRATAKVTFVGIPHTIPSDPIYVEVQQGLGRHDVICLNYLQTDPWMGLLQTGTPMTLLWGNSKATSTIYGYVTHTAPSTGTTINQKAKIYCIGASYPLKDKGSNVWENMSGPQIARSIARRFGMGINTDDTGGYLTQVLQAGRSYWQTLIDVADRTGHVVTLSGATINFKTRDRLIDEHISSAPTFSLGPNKYVGNPGFDRTLWEFKPKLGTYLEDTMRATQSIGGVDPMTGGIFDVTSSSSRRPMRNTPLTGMFQAHPSDRAAGSFWEATSAAKSKAENVRMSITAEAVAFGAADTKPGHPIHIKGTGAITDGYWLVDRVVHGIYSAGEYQMDLSLVTDSLGTSRSDGFRPSKPPSRAYRNLSQSPPSLSLTLAPRLSHTHPTLAAGQAWTSGGLS